MDETTRRSLRWHEIWSRFQPRTPMGQRAKETLSPFMPGEEKEWQRSLAEQEGLWAARNSREEWGLQVEKRLKRLPDPTAVLRMLERGEIPQVSDWFRLKQFLWQGRLLREMIPEAAPDFRFRTRKEEWREGIALLDPGPHPSAAFALTPALDPRLGPLQSRRDEEERRAAEAGERAAAAVEEDYSLRRNREGEWVVDRHSPVLKQMMEDPRVLRVRETPFEVICRPSPTQEETEAIRRLDRIREELEAVEREVLTRLVASFQPKLPFLAVAVEEMVHLDLQWARMRAAEEWGGTRPLPGESYRIEGGIHPLVADTLELQGRTFTPVDVEVGRGATVIIGPNMGGKTVALTTVGLIAALGQYGFRVPARRCSMPLAPWLVGVIGDGQDPRFGLSTFGAEVRRIADIFSLPEGGLLLTDEVGRGTNPVEGAALSAALTSHLARCGNRSLQVTHFREVLEIREARVYRVMGLSRDLRTSSSPVPRGLGERSLAEGMDYRLTPWAGEPVPRDALTIARLLGLPRGILQDAHRRLGQTATEDEEATESKGVEE